MVEQMYNLLIAAYYESPLTVTFPSPSRSNGYNSISFAFNILNKLHHIYRYEKTVKTRSTVSNRKKELDLTPR